MLAKLRPRLTYANVMSTIAVFVAVSTGGAYAANTVFSIDIVDGEVKTADLASGSVSGGKVADNSLTGADVLGKPGTSTAPAVNGSLTTDDIAGQQANAANGTPFIDGSLTQWDLKNGSVTGSDVVESSLAKVPDANELDGHDSTAFTQPACFNQSGAVKGYARIQANEGFSTTFTTVGVNFPYNCSGATIEARRLSLGTYEVRFNWNPAQLALASELQADGDPSAQIATVAAGAPGTFRVEVRNLDFEPISFVDSTFMIAVFF
jgi:hypothetical protein